jgi:membrane associated rhomboid family serine protease
MKWPRVEIPISEWMRRLPAVSVGLVVVWIVASAVLQLGYASQLRSAREELGEAVGYAIQNPVVAVDPRMFPVVRAVMPGFDSNEVFAFLRHGRSGRQGPSPQEHFDALSAQAFRSLDALPQRRLGLVPAFPELHAILTYALVHAGWLHLLGTVLVWLLVAPLLERLWGRAVFTGAVVCVVLAGGGGYFLARMGSDRALLGGSALVAGLVVAALVRFRGREVDLLGCLAPCADVELRAPAWSLGLVWVVHETLLWWTVPGALPAGVAHSPGYAAHAAGALLGGLLPLAITRLGWEERFGRPEPAAQPAKPARFDFQRVLEARARGDADAAFEMLRVEVQRSSRHRDAVTTFWEMCIERAAPEQAAPAMAQLVGEELRRGAEEIAVALWRELAEHRLSSALDSPTLLRLVRLIQRIDGDEQTVIALRQLLDRRRKDLTPTGAYQVAQLAEGLDPELALAAGRRATASEKLEPGKRVELEALVARVTPPEEGGIPETAKPPEEPPPSIFYQESDRSAFGEVGDLSELDGSFPRGAVTEAIPRQLGAEALSIEIAGGELKGVAWSRLRAVAVVGVRGLASRPVVLIDLLVDGGGMERPLGVIRIRSDRFDPRRLAPQASSPLEALRAVVKGILSQSGARPLPDLEGAAGGPVRIYDSLDAYEAQVLRPVAPELS